MTAVRDTDRASTIASSSEGLVPLPAPRRAHARPQAPVVTQWDASVQRILCFRPDNMGDVLMTTPALRALKRRFPERRLTLLASRSGAAVARFIPYIDEVIEFDPPWARNDGMARAEDTMALVRRLAEGDFDAAVLFTVYSQNPLPAAMVCHLAGIPRRLAYCRENPYGLLSDWVPETEPDLTLRHEAQRQLDLVAAIGATISSADGSRAGTAVGTGFARGADTKTDLAAGVDGDDDASLLGTAGHAAEDDGDDADHGDPRALVFALDPDSRAALHDALSQRGVAATEDYLVFHPGATAASRRWSPIRFTETIVALASATGLRCYITGGPDETALCGSIAAAARRELDARNQAAGDATADDGADAATIVDLSGALSLGALATLIDGATLLVTNNSGPLHLASARATPVVVLYALTNPQHGPWRTAHRLLSNDVPCRWCYKSVCPERHHLCLEGVTTTEVIAAALDLLHETSGIRPSVRSAQSAQSALSEYSAHPVPLNWSSSAANGHDTEFHPADAFPSDAAAGDAAPIMIDAATGGDDFPALSGARAGRIGELIGDSDVAAVDDPAALVFPLLDADDLPPTARQATIQSRSEADAEPRVAAAIAPPASPPTLTSTD
ncbi:glycosyltransferase family 9 protein [Chitinasiproducens palmae]|uniref:Glycosyltransferase family 9 (Heptosyltransferase) n=1 Tax=Chitinasiproducens palmae TaxID=1770053 RepID=A0A1H2PQL4_9BURK|nr:glycosyltransferase family 9 protein [Chitinasiproducens palmae]SDV49122.1 Glycosyltransferase family 9 (heptosyltransferase) [Chitinasiproducens palmae]